MNINMSKQMPAFLALLGASAILLTGCESQGPAQQAGEQIDKGVQRAKDALDPAGPLEKAGREIDKATGK